MNKSVYSRCSRFVSLFIVLAMFVALPVQANEPPVVNLTKPANGDLYVPGSIPLAATASDPDGSVNLVEFLSGSTLLGSDNNNPYGVTWNNVAGGNYNVLARATDSVGAQSYSQTNSITVKAPENVVWTQFANANAQGNNLYRDDAYGDYEWNAGAISTRCLLSGNGYVESTVAHADQFRCDQIFGLSRGNANASYTDIDFGIYLGADGTDVRVYESGVYRGSFGAFAMGDKYRVEVIGTSVVYKKNGTVFYTSAVTLTGANYPLLVDAALYHAYEYEDQDYNYHLAMSTLQDVKLNGVNLVNNPPSVSLTAPASGTVVSAPATITLNATASHVSGSIARVEFYSGSTLLGNDLSAPYSYVWNNVAAGNYSLKARAVDGTGNSADSAVASLTVNALPTISIVQPPSGATYTALATVIIEAEAADSDGSISKVEFYSGTTLLNTDLVSPYTYVWNNVLAGIYSLVAKATDTLGGTATSAAVSITVNVDSNNEPPTISLTSPVDGQMFLAPVNIALAATAQDADGGVNVVEFFSGSTLIGSGNTAPYAVTWNNVTAGNYNITAKATDSMGVSTISSPAAVITVKAPENVVWTQLERAVADGNNLYREEAYSDYEWNAGAISTRALLSGNGYVETAMAHANQFRCEQVFGLSKGNSNSSYSDIDFGIYIGSDGTEVRVYESGVYKAGSGAFAMGDKFRVEVIGSSVVYKKNGTVFYTSAVTLTAAHYPLLVDTSLYHAYEYEHEGDYYYAVSSFHDVKLNGVNLVNNPPSVSLTAPASGTVVSAPATITLNATASHVSGSIARVEFYSGSTLLGNDLSAPYSYLWNNVAAGNYSLKARAVDGTGNSSDSSLVSIAVTLFPQVTLTQPSLGTTYIAPATVELAAEASDPDGTISKVEFYHGSALIASDLDQPYEFTWNNVEAGFYNLTAKAFDNVNAQTNSSAVIITVKPNLPVADSVKLWLKADGINGLADGAAVTIWPDRSINRFQATQSNSSKQPVYKANIINSKPVVRFDGVNDVMDLGSARINLNALTIFYVTKTASPRKSIQGILSFDDDQTVGTGNSSFEIIGYDDDSTGSPNNFGTLVKFNRAIAAKTALKRDYLNFDTFDIHGVRWTGFNNKVQIFHNGSQINLSAPTDIDDIMTQAPVAEQINIGLGYDIGSGTETPFLKGDIAEIIIYDQSLTNEERTQVETYLSLKYGVNVPPVVNITLPANGAIYTGLTTVSMIAQASDPNGNLSKVEFYYGSTLLGTDLTEPYEVAWNIQKYGTFTITALAVDSSGSFASSAPVSFEVIPDQSYILPSVLILDPLDKTSHIPGKDLTIKAYASATNQVAEVKFYVNSVLIGTDTQAPYTCTWTNPQPGTYQITAAAWDFLGAKGISNPRDIKIKGSVTQTFYSNNFQGTIGNEWSIQQTDVTNAGNRTFLGQFGNQTVNLTLTNLPPHLGVLISFDLFLLNSWDGNHTGYGPDIWELNSPGSQVLLKSTFSNLDEYSWNQGYPGTYPAGNYPPHTGAAEVDTLDCVYHGDSVYRINRSLLHNANNLHLNFLAQGLQSIEDESWGIDNIEIKGQLLPPPQVTIINPTNNEIVTTESRSIKINADASDQDGYIRIVDFYANNILLGSDFSSPYEVEWTEIQGGQYTLHANTRDDDGFSSTSSPVAVSVFVPPSSANAIGISSSQIALSWNGKSTGPGQITIKRSINPEDGYVNVATLNRNVQSFLDEGLAPSTEYFYLICDSESGANLCASPVSAMTFGHIQPLPITNALAWYRAEAGLEHEDLIIHQWKDQSGHNRHASQADSGFRPELLLTGASNNPTLYFDGQSRHLNFSELVATNFTIFTVNRRVVESVSGSLLAGDLASTNRFYADNGNVNQTLCVTMGTPTAGSYSNACFNANFNDRFHLECIQKSSSGLEFRQDGIPMSTTDGSISNNLAAFQSIGAIKDGVVVTNAYTGSLAEIIIFNVALSESEVQNIEDYLMTKHGLKVDDAITIVSPDQNYFLPSETIEISAERSQTYTQFQRVEFYVKAASSGTAQLIGSDSQPPYSTTWSTSTSGHYDLTAKGITISNVEIASDPVHIIISTPPSISITTPSNGATFEAPAAVNVEVNANDPDGSVEQVLFYVNGVLINQLSTPPFSTTWNTEIAGEFALIASAVDNHGRFATVNNPVNITVNPNATNSAPVVSITAPSDQQTFVEQSDISITADADDVPHGISSVEFYAGTQLLDTAHSSPYSTEWKNVPVGTYNLKAKAFDTLGAAAVSSLKQIFVNQNAVPVISITSPSNGSSVETLTDIEFIASVTDADNAIQEVQFFVGETWIGSDFGSPYVSRWTVLDPGTFSLKATAVDILGGIGTSSTVNIIASGTAYGSTPIKWTNLTNCLSTENVLFKKSYGTNGWNAGAISAQKVLSGNAYVQVETQENHLETDQMFGFSRLSVGESYEEIQFAIRLQLGQIYVYESGVQKGGVLGTYVPEDQIRIELRNNQVKYVKNGALFYTSATTLTSNSYPIIVDASLFDSYPSSRYSSTIENARIGGSNIEQPLGDNSALPTPPPSYVPCNAMESPSRGVNRLGVPIPETGPTGEVDTDYKPDQFFIDMYSLLPTYTATDISIPIVGDELALEFKRTSRLSKHVADYQYNWGQVYAVDNILGLGWACNIGANIRFQESAGKVVAVVSDEDGASYEFIQGGNAGSRTFTPDLRNGFNNQVLQTSLKATSQDSFKIIEMEFRKKHGTRMIFKRRLPTMQGDLNYLRLYKIIDRNNNAILYEYAMDDGFNYTEKNHLPTKISNGGRYITFAYEKGRLITVKSATQQIGYSYTSFASGFPDQLERVNYADASVSFKYLIAENAYPLYKGSTTTSGTVGGEMPVRWSVIHQVTDPRGAITTFNYLTPENTSTLPLTPTFLIPTGSFYWSKEPRLSSVETSASFGLKNVAYFDRKSISVVPSSDGASVTLETSAKDASGKMTYYKFEGKVYSRSNRIGKALYFTQQTRSRGGVSVTYNYSADGNSNLLSVLDASENKIVYSYENTSGFTNPDHGKLFGLPSSKIQYLGTSAVTTRYEYEQKFNKKKKITDPEGKVSTYVINSVNGNLESETHASGTLNAKTTYKYNTQGFLTYITDPTGRITKRTPDNFGYLGTSSIIINPENIALNIKTQYVHNSVGFLTTVIDPNGNVTKHFPDSRDRIKYTVLPAVQDPFNPQQLIKPTIVYIYDSNGNVTAILEDNKKASGLVKKETLISYDSLNRPQSTSLRLDDDSFITTSKSYYANGNLKSETDPKGRETTYIYDLYGRLIEKIFPSLILSDGSTRSFSETYSYGANSGSGAFNYNDFKPVLIVNRRGTTTSFSYDSLYQERSIYRISKDGTYSQKTEKSYDKSGNLSKELKTGGKSPNQQTFYFYDDLHRVTLKVLDYNLDGSVGINPGTFVNNPEDTAIQSSLNPADYHRKYRYDLSGKLTDEIDPEGRRTSYEYDKAGRQTTISLPQGEYSDDNGTIISGQRPTLTTGYDKNGNKTIVTDAKGTRTKSFYNSHNHVIKTILDLDKDGQFEDNRPGDDIVTSFIYDLLGNLIKTKDTRNQVIEQRYDRAGRLHKVITPVVWDEESATNKEGLTEYEYDKNSNIITTVDNRNVFTRTEYDEWNRPARKYVERDQAFKEPGKTDWLLSEMNYTVSDALKEVVAYNQIDNANVITQKTTYTYDDFDQRLSETLPVEGSSVRSTFYEYDSLGNVIFVTYPNGDTTRTSFDAANKPKQIVTTKKLPSGSFGTPQITTFVYSKTGKIKTATDPNGESRYTYDALDRVKTEERWVNNSLQYQVQSYYDFNNNRTKVIYPGRTLINVYDPLNRIKEIKDSRDGNTVYVHDHNLNKITCRKPVQNLVTIYENDALNRLMKESTSSSAGHIYTAEYFYDLAGNRKKITEKYNSEALQTRTFVYDTQYRVTSEKFEETLKEELYGYDRIGNRRTSETKIAGVSQGVTTYGYNNLNQITSQVKAGVTTSYAYDLNGNLQTKSSGSASTTYKYDVQNRLISVEQGGSTIFSANYDYRTRRLSTTEGGTTTTFQYDGGDCFRETQGSSVQAEFVRGSGMGGGIGSILYRNKGTQKEFFVYNAVGHTVGLVGNSGTTVKTDKYDAFGKVYAFTGTSDNNRLANTKERSVALGLDNHGFRYYDPEIGRYISRDPLGYGDGLNPYLYVKNNPVNLIDPLGLWAWDGDWIQKGLGGLVGFYGSSVAGDGWKATKTGAKAVVNAAASTAVSTVTLGTVDNYEGPIAVTQQDLDNEYRLANGVAKVGTEISVGLATGALSSCNKIGAAVKVMDAASNGVQLGKGINDVAENGLTVENGLQIAGALMGGAGNIKAAKDAPECFVAGTLILAAGGLVPIEEIEVGDWVWSCDVETGEKSLKPVTRTFQKTTDVIVTLKVGDEIIRTTDEHPFWVQGDGWVEAGNLLAGYEFVTTNGIGCRLEQLNLEHIKAQVYNFEVYENHTYYVSEKSLLVHNSCTSENIFPSSAQGMTEKLGIPPTKVGVTPDGTPRTTWEPNQNTRIRHESHPEGLQPGDSNYNPRHHGEHYHVETKPDGLSWNQAKNQGLLIKAKPDGYTPGSGTGYLPGEKFPGAK